MTQPNAKTRRRTAAHEPASLKPAARFGPDARRFFTEIAANNNRVWFKANQDRYTAAVLEPAAALVEELGARLGETYPTLRYGSQLNGSGSIMRIHRDVRFAKDKRPYKESLGLVLWLGEGGKMERPSFYFHLEPRSAFFYGGQHVFPKPTLERYRQAVDDDKRGRALERLLGRLADMGLKVYEEPAYKKVPRGYTPDHPRAALLRQGGLGASKTLSLSETASPGLAATCAKLAVGMKPLMDWLLALDDPPRGR